MAGDGEGGGAGGGWDGWNILALERSRVYYSEYRCSHTDDTIILLGEQL
jgi:hypothetical protein